MSMLDWIIPPPLAFAFYAAGARDTLERFHRDFGDDRCPICSLHKFGIDRGYVRGAVGEHTCPEVAALSPQEPSGSAAEEKADA
jgi:hypothetical protein